MLDYFQYYQDGAQKREQQGVIRTNCLQSVERTNIVQSRIGLRMLKKQLAHHKIDVATKVASDGRTLLDNFTKLWSDNGNSLNYQYTNTDSTQGMFKSITSGLKSLMNSTNGTEKQQHFDLLLGASAACSSPSKHSESAPEFTVRLFVGSWNLAGGMPDMSLDLSKWIESGKELP
eukprot:TRINITY_DN2333_c0_g4_i1.p4 TRINITY_DN2333_c0_g4~~TRINITY_DN2333_c0_g4_i1.p4  ORF type:complete len:175 (-),score=42.21 TRINITY_DN2333_c0_g4_i1:1002-1526(-)